MVGSIVLWRTWGERLDGGECSAESYLDDRGQARVLVPPEALGCSELFYRGSEDPSVFIDVRGSGGRGHESHVVERGEEDAAIEGVEMHEPFEFEISVSSGFAAIARRMRMKEIF